MTHKTYKVDRKALLIGETVKAPATLKTISENGLGVECSKKAGLGTRLEVEFSIPALGRIQDLSVYAVVNHIHNTSDGYFLGFEYEVLSPEEKAIIKDFIEYKERLHELGQKHFKHITE